MLPSILRSLVLQATPLFWSKSLHILGICQYISFKVFGLLLMIGASLMAQMIKNPLAVQEKWVQSLGQEDPLEDETATHSCILAWRILWTEKPGQLQSMGLQRVRQLLRARCPWKIPLWEQPNEQIRKDRNYSGSSLYYE